MLDEHAENHPRDVKEQIYKSLQSFGQKTDLCSFDFQELMNILINNSHQELAEMIEKDPRFSPLFPSDSVEGNMSEFNNVSRTQWIGSNCHLQGLHDVYHTRIVCWSLCPIVVWSGLLAMYRYWSECFCKFWMVQVQYFDLFDCINDFIFHVHCLVMFEVYYIIQDGW